MVTLVGSSSGGGDSGRGRDGDGAEGQDGGHSKRPRLVSEMMDVVLTGDDGRSSLPLLPFYLSKMDTSVLLNPIAAGTAMCATNALVLRAQNRWRASPRT